MASMNDTARVCAAVLITYAATCIALSSPSTLVLLSGTECDLERGKKLAELWIFATATLASYTWPVPVICCLLIWFNNHPEVGESIYRWTHGHRSYKKEKAKTKALLLLHIPVGMIGPGIRNEPPNMTRPVNDKLYLTVCNSEAKQNTSTHTTIVLHEEQGFGYIDAQLKLRQTIDVHLFSDIVLEA
jgi:hypothetical protein